MSLHIGVNLLDPSCYPLDPPDDRWPDGWDGELAGCHCDAEEMQKIAEEQGFKTTILRSEEATVESVKAEIKKAADELVAGDIFFLSYAGHGGRVKDVTGDEGKDDFGKKDKWDETWCLYDRHLIDDEQQVMFTEFASGVRVLVLSDSCHSGTVNRSSDDDEVVRAMPEDRALPCYTARSDEYDSIQRNLPKVTLDDVKANFLLIAACREDQKAGDGIPNGKFTAAVLKTWKAWNENQKTGTYRELHEAVVKELELSFDEAKESFARGERSRKPKLQTPKFEEGKSRESSFYDESPFSI